MVSGLGFLEQPNRDLGGGDTGSIHGDSIVTVSVEEMQRKLLLSYSDSVGGSNSYLLGHEIKSLLSRVPDKYLQINLSDIGLSVRTNNAMASAGIKDFRDLAKFDDNGLVGLRNFGRKSLDELRRVAATLLTLSNGFVDDVGTKVQLGFVLSIDGAVDVDKQVFDRMTVRSIGLSQRTVNSLFNAGYKNVGDILELSEDALTAIPGFGKKCLVDLRTQITKQISFIRLHGGCIDTPGCPGEVGDWQVFDCLDSRDKLLLAGRSEYKKVGKTFRELGEEIGISHERVRQLVTQAIQRVVVHLPFQTFVAHILRHLKDGDAPLSCEGIADLFGGLPVDFSHEILECVTSSCDLGLWFVDVCSSCYLMDISTERYHEMIDCAVEYLVAAGHDASISYSDVVDYVENITVQSGKSARSLMLHEIASQLEFSELGSGRLMGRSDIKTRLLTILNDSDVPLHYSAVTEKYREIWGGITERQIHSAFQRGGDECILFGRGIYGLAKHIKVSDDERLRLQSAAIEIVKANPSRQWHVSEIADEIESRGYALGEKIDNYVLAELIKSTGEVGCLNRGVFSADLNQAASSDRIQMHQAIESILLRECRPMSGEDIRKALSEIRGIPRACQILPTDNVVKIDATHWGLLNRDVEISSEDQVRLVKCLRDALVASGCGIHISEVGDICTKAIGVDLDPVLIFSLCGRYGEGQVKTSVSEYLYLNEWGGTRRMSISGAVIEALGSMRMAFSSKELVEKASQILGREVPLNAIYAPMKDCGWRYDEGVSKWIKR